MTRESNIAAQERFGAAVNSGDPSVFDEIVVVEKAGRTRSDLPRVGLPLTRGQVWLSRVASVHSTCSR